MQMYSAVSEPPQLTSHICSSIFCTHYIKFAITVAIFKKRREELYVLYIGQLELILFTDELVVLSDTEEALQHNIG